MSTIPPNWMASVLGTRDTQRAAGVNKNQEAADQIKRSAGPKFADGLHNVIENSDRDGEVYADAEGLGSQGRASDEPPKETADSPEQADDKTGTGLDVQA